MKTKDDSDVRIPVRSLNAGDIIKHDKKHYRYIGHATRRGSKLWQLTLAHENGSGPVLLWLSPEDFITRARCASGLELFEQVITGDARKPSIHKTMKNTTNQNKITREQWLSRCAARFTSVAKVGDKAAMDMAESQLKNLNDDLTESPEQAADDEMSYWTAD